MSWESVNLAEVSLTLAPLPEDNYTFRLLGAQFDENIPGKIVVKAAVVTENEFMGRRVRFTYPDPDTYDWSPRALKRLENATGIDVTPNEDPVEYLNRAAGETALFSADIKHRKYLPEGATEEVTSAELNIFTVAPGV